MKTSMTWTLVAMAASNLFLSPQEILLIAQENKYYGIFKKKILFYHENACCVYSLKPPHRGNS